MKKIVRIITYLVAGFIVLLLLGLLGLKLFFPVEKAKALAIERGEKLLGREISISTVDLSVWGGIGIRLQNVEIGNPENWNDTTPFLQAEDIDLKLQILPILAQKYKIDQLIINRPEIHLHRKDDGSDNFTFSRLDTLAPVDLPTKLGSEEKVAAAAISFERFSINDGTLIYHDDSVGDAITASDFQMSTSLTSKSADIYRSRGKLSIGRLDLLVDDTLQSVRVELDYDADYTISEKSLRVHETELTLNNLPIIIDGELQFSDDTTSARVSLISEDLDLEQLVSSLSKPEQALLSRLSIDGNVNLRFDIDYNSLRDVTYKYTGTVSLNELAIGHADLPERLVVKGGMVDIKNDNLRLIVEQASFKNEPVRINLVVNDFAQPYVNGELSGTIDLEMLQSIMPDSMVEALSGTIRVSCKVAGLIQNIDDLIVSGDIEIKDGSCQPFDFSQRIEQINLSAHFDNETVLVNKLSIRVDSSLVSFEGRVQKLLPYILSDDSLFPAVDLIIDGKLNFEIDLNLLEQFLPQENYPALTGLANLSSTIKGNPLDPASLNLLGQLRVNDAAYFDSTLSEPIRDLDAEFVVIGDTLRIDQCEIQFESSNLNLKGVVFGFWSGLFSKEGKSQRPRMNFTMTSRRFNVDSLFPEVSPASDLQNGTVAIDTVPPLIIADIDAKGTFVFDTLIYSDIPMIDVTGNIKLENRLLTCSDVQGVVYGGSLSGNTSIDISDMEAPMYTGSFKVNQVEASAVASRFSSFGEVLSGKIDLSGDYQGTGWDPEEFKRSLNMTSDLSMRSGKLVTTGELFSNIKTLAAKVGHPLDSEQPLRNLSTKIKVQDGKVSFDDLKTRLGTLGDLSLSGFYSIDGEISYSGGLQLSESATSKLLSSGNLLSGLASVLTDKSVKRVKLPLLISGTMSKPKLEIDYSVIKDNVKKDLSEQAGNLLKGLFKKDKK